MSDYRYVFENRTLPKVEVTVQNGGWNVVFEQEYGTNVHSVEFDIENLPLLIDTLRQIQAMREAKAA